MTETVFEFWDPKKAPRLAGGWSSLAEELSDGEWHRRDVLIEHVLASSDLARSTAGNLCHNAVHAGLLQKRAGRRGIRYYRIHPEHRDDFERTRSFVYPDESTPDQGGANGD